MSDIHNLNVVLFPKDRDGIQPVALEAFSVAFGHPAIGTDVAALIAVRDLIEKSLTDDAERPSAIELHDYGCKLAAALLSGPVRDLYTLIGDQRVELGISAEEPALKKVPWEFLVWPDKGSALVSNRSIARIVASRRSVHTPRKLSDGQLRVLLIGADVLGMAPIGWERTKANLIRMFGERLRAGAAALPVQLDLVEGASEQLIRDALLRTKYDIVQFIGHGAPNGVMLRSSNGQAGELLSSDALSNLLSLSKPLVVILSACDTGKIDQLAPLGNVAEILVRNEVPAVVAHQMPITVSVIAEFSTALYQALLTDGSIDYAVAIGRGAVLSDLAKRSASVVEWGIPILYRRQGCSQLFVV